MIVTYTPATIDLHPGDTFVEVAGGWQQKRGATLVATFLRINMARAILAAPVFINSSTRFAFYKEEQMAGQNIAMTAVAKDDSTGSITYSFSNGAEKEFASFAAVKDSVAYIDTTPDVAIDTLIAKSVKNSPDGTNLENMVGASMAINLSADIPFVLTNPEP